MPYRTSAKQSVVNKANDSSWVAKMTCKTFGHSYGFFDTQKSIFAVNQLDWINSCEIYCNRCKQTLKSSGFSIEEFTDKEFPLYSIKGKYFKYMLQEQIAFMDRHLNNQTETANFRDNLSGYRMAKIHKTFF